jgi:hypothetical protein
MLAGQHTSENLSDWEAETISVIQNGETVFTLRTHEFIVENKSPIYRMIARLNTVLLIVFTLVLLGLIALSVAMSLLLLNNLHVINEMKTQIVPGSAGYHSTH